MPFSWAFDYTSLLSFDPVCISYCLQGTYSGYLGHSLYVEKSNISNNESKVDMNS